jgi:probable HAF family extracellular repeat protein
MTASVYTAIDPPGSTYTDTQVINALGQIVGYYSYSGEASAFLGFLYSGGTYTTIDFPGSTQTVATSINDSGQIVGYFTDSSSGAQHVFLYSGGTYTLIDPSGGTGGDSETFSINNAGQIVGDYSDGSSEHGFLYSGGSYTTIDFPGGTNDFLYSINDSGQIVGSYQYSDGHSHGFVYSGGIYTTIDPTNLPGNNISTITTAINDAGQIIGDYTAASASGTHDHGFLYSGGTYTLIEPPGSTSSYVYSVNDSEQIVGTYYNNSGAHGFLYSGGTYTTIDWSGGNVGVAFINDAGQIVGDLRDSTGVDHGFVLNSVTVPIMTNATFDAAQNLTVLSGIAEADSNVKVFDGVNLVGTATAAADGTWGLTANVTGKGIHSYTETSTDMAGIIISSGDVTLYAPGANKVLTGGTGNDVLIGRPNDHLWGGPNDDTFKFNLGSGKEVINDFNQGNLAVGSAAVEHDIINVHAYGFANWSALQALISDNNSGDAVVHLSQSDSITLIGVHTANLHASDFIV